MRWAQQEWDLLLLLRQFSDLRNLKQLSAHNMLYLLKVQEWCNLLLFVKVFHLKPRHTIGMFRPER
jgi:hypothetical protein